MVDEMQLIYHFQAICTKILKLLFKFLYTNSAILKLNNNRMKYCAPISPLNLFTIYVDMKEPQLMF